MPLFKFYEAQNRLIRNLKIKDYFSNRCNVNYDANKKKFTNPSSWTPPDHHVGSNTLNTIQQIVTNTESVLSNFKIRKNQFIMLNNRKINLTNCEKLALDKIRNNDSVIIKPADKGGATVVMNKTAYLNEAYRQLNNNKYYVKLDGPAFRNNITKINNVLKIMKTENFVNFKQYQFLQAKESDRARIFYLLPKIHKPRDKWPQLDMPEGRPIVSDCMSESYRISQFIDSYIRPISVKHFAYIKDTYDFINKVRGLKIPHGALLVTGDVTSLYTNMDIDRTMSVTRTALAEHNPNQRLNEHLLNLLEITLRNNDFEFNGESYLQICGTAMGKSYAPGLADLYMQEIDRKACHDFKPELINSYFRFLDDIFFTWFGTVAELKELEDYLNSLIPGIKITFTHSEDKIDFLDTTIYKSLENDQVTLLTKVFFKETDTHQLLHKASFHPKHTFNGVLKSQLLRFKRISSNFADYNNACKILFNALAKRNYSKSLLRKMKRDIWGLDDTLKRVAPVISEDLPIVIPFCHLGNALAKNWKNSVSKNDKFKNFRLITAYCNSKNLRKTLVRGSLIVGGNNVRPRNTNSVPCGNLAVGMYCCHSARCKACNYIKPSNKFTSTFNNRSFNIKSNLTCDSANVIYLITCKQCHRQYVGQTGRALRDRICDHLSNIRTHKSTPIALHFNLPNHSLTDFEIMAIEQSPDTENSLHLRLLKETTWQNLLQTAYPLGINNFKRDYLI
jgi:hypothetical protein